MDAHIASTCTGKTSEQQVRQSKALWLDAWEESPYYTDRERAALTWAESVTNIQEGHVPDGVFERVKEFFNDKELADLTLAVTRSIRGTV
jgi:alkylhydroperoxidase family enzyme